jgi:hypothetical protein
MKDGSSTTVSASRKVNLELIDKSRKFENEDVFVSLTVTPEMTVEDMQNLVSLSASAYELVIEELERRVALINNRYSPKPKEDPDAHTATVKKRVEMLGFTKEQCREFRTVCENVGKDHISTFLCAWEESCVSHDQFIRYAATGERPATAKPRLEVAQ